MKPYLIDSVGDLDEHSRYIDNLALELGCTKQCIRYEKCISDYKDRVDIHCYGETAVVQFYYYIDIETKVANIFKKHCEGNKKK